MLCLISHHQRSLFLDSVYMSMFHHWKLRSGASCALVCVAAHLVCIQLTLLRMWSVWCLFLFCHGLMLTDHSLSLSLPLTLSLSLSLSVSPSPSLPLSLTLSLHATLLCLELNLRLSPEEPGTCVSAHESSHLCFFCFHTSVSRALIIIHPSSFTDPHYANLASPL